MGLPVAAFIRSDDGTNKIQKGLVTYNGKAYWVDECTSSTTGNVGLKVLSKGTFNFKAGTFTGSWTASSSISGYYLSFYHYTQDDTTSGMATTPAYATATATAPELESSEPLPEPFAPQPTTTSDPTANVVPIVPVVPVVPTPGTVKNDAEEDIEVEATPAVIVPNPGVINPLTVFGTSWKARPTH